VVSSASSCFLLGKSVSITGASTSASVLLYRYRIQLPSWRYRQKTYFKGTVSRDFLLHESSSPKPLNHFEKPGRYLQIKVHHRYQRNRRQISPPVPLVSLIPWGKFASGVNDTGGTVPLRVTRPLSIYNNIKSMICLYVPHLSSGEGGFIKSLYYMPLCLIVFSWTVQITHEQVENIMMHATTNFRIFFEKAPGQLLSVVGNSIMQIDNRWIDANRITI
jgi:hypothetical protein